MTLRMLALVIALLALAPATAAATSAADQIAALNAQREANGIPAGIVEVPDWSEGCRLHMAYIEANGGTLTHEEDKSKPGLHEGGRRDRPPRRPDPARRRLQRARQRLRVRPAAPHAGALADALADGRLGRLRDDVRGLRPQGRAAGALHVPRRRRDRRLPVRCARWRCRSCPATSSASRRARRQARTSTSCRTAPRPGRITSASLDGPLRARRDPRRRQRDGGPRGLPRRRRDHHPGRAARAGRLPRRARRSSPRAGPRCRARGASDDLMPPVAPSPCRSPTAGASARDGGRRATGDRRRAAPRGCPPLGPQQCGSGSSRARRSSAAAPRSAWFASCARARAAAAARIARRAAAPLGHRSAGRPPDRQGAAAGQGPDDQGRRADAGVPARRACRTPRGSPSVAGPALTRPQADGPSARLRNRPLRLRG